MANPIRLVKKFKLLRKTEMDGMRHPTIGFGWDKDVVDHSFDSEDEAMTYCTRMNIYDVYIVPYISPVWYEDRGKD